MVCLYCLEEFPQFAAPFLWDSIILDCGYCAKVIMWIQLVYTELVLIYDFLVKGGGIKTEKHLSHCLYLCNILCGLYINSYAFRCCTWKLLYL